MGAALVVKARVVVAEVKNLSTHLHKWDLGSDIK